VVPLWLRSVATTLLFPGVVAGLVPILLARGAWRLPLPLGPVRWLGLAFVLPGLAGLWIKIRGFARGGGTLAPWDAPSRLVHDRLYARVRNPMYISVLATILGQALLWASGGILVYLSLVATMFHLRVVFAEEPDLRRRFGSGFEAYLDRVPRWIPRRPGHPSPPPRNST
jgi:protein-S-isoprenylcysteine O-methyltransferase Ste14